MLRPVLRLSLASVFVLLGACGDDVAVTTTGDSSTGATTSEETSTTKPTSEPTTTVTTVTTGDTDVTGTTVDTSTTEGETATTVTTGDTDTDTDTDTGGSVCDNGVIEKGEACDGDDLAGQDCVMQGFDAGTLACADDCATFDNSGCSTITCGDGSLQGNEICDGAELAGQDCVAQGFEGGTLACADNCGSYELAGCFKCGDDLVGGVEVCDGADLAGATCMSQGFDDGVLACALDCGALDNAGCFSCGDDVIAGSEVCDGAELAGEDCVSQGFEAGTLACADDCGAFNSSACTTCGDGQAAGAEECDGADLKANTCATQGADFGTLGCTADCTFDASACIKAVEETEPNDDGMTAVNTSDFSAANANGPFTKNTIIHGAIDPAGDDDIYKVTNTSPNFATLRVETFGGDGPGTCVSTDTYLELRTAANALLASDDDSGISTCSLIPSYALAAGETVYVRVIEYGDNAPLASYYLDIQLDTVVCGDGIGGAGEQCDDGNIVANDGCSPTCTVEGGVVEIEPNSTNAEADATGIVSTGTSKFIGAITPIVDVDRYRIDLAAAQFLRFESFSALNDCTNISTTVRLFNAANMPIIADTSAAGIGGCGALVFPLPAGTAYLQIEESGNNALVPAYVLELATLGDAGLESEPNDDIANADINIQMAPSDSIVFGDHSLNLDVDYYALNVPAGASLRLEVIEGDRAVETCESNEVDSEVTLYDSMGVELANDDDAGRGYCSLIDGTGSTPSSAGAHNLPGGTYYVQVRASDLSQGAETRGQFIYRLVTTIRKP